MQNNWQDVGTAVEREAVKRERGAYVAGALDAMNEIWRGKPYDRDVSARLYEVLGARKNERYPRPKVTRLREVKDGIMEFRASQAYPCGIEGSFVGENNWVDAMYGGFNGTPERYRLFADLIANPTEEVEDNG